MAKNWTVAEAANVIVNNGINNEDVMDFGRRFPVTTNLITAALAGCKESLITLLGMLPDYVTMGKMEKNFKEAADTTEAEGTDDAEDTEETEATESGEKDYSEMNNKELKAALRQAGFKSAEIKGKNKAAMLEMLKAGANAADDDADEVEETDEEDAAEEAVDYSKMTAKDLYKLCKSKGIDVEQKKPAKYYIDALTAEEAEAETEDDEWEEEVPAAKPAKDKKGNKSSKDKKSSKNSKGNSKKSEKSTAKAEPKAAKAEEDEWDI